MGVSGEHVLCAAGRVGSAEHGIETTGIWLPTHGTEGGTAVGFEDFKTPCVTDSRHHHHCQSNVPTSRCLQPLLPDATLRATKRLSRLHAATGTFPVTNCISKPFQAGAQLTARAGCRGSSRGRQLPGWTALPWGCCCWPD